jgi:hypothetical protein
LTFLTFDAALLLQITKDISMKLNYWIKPHKTDTKQTLRGRTKGEVEIAFAKGEGAGKFNADNFNASFKVTVDYKDGYDLMTKLRDETLSELPVVNVISAVNISAKEATLHEGDAGEVKTA